MDVNKLLDLAKEAIGVEFDKDLAPRLGVKPTSVSNYRKGVSLPDAVVCAALAGLTGLPLTKVIGIVGEARAISREEKAVWRKLAATAVLLAVMVFPTLPTTAKAHTEPFNTTQAMHYAKCKVVGPTAGLVDTLPGTMRCRPSGSGRLAFSAGRIDTCVHGRHQASTASRA